MAIIDSGGYVAQSIALPSARRVRIDDEDSDLKLDIRAYAYMGLHMRRWFAEPSGKRLFNRCCAGLLSAAATVLLMARRA